MVCVEGSVGAVTTQSVQYISEPPANHKHLLPESFGGVATPFDIAEYRNVYLLPNTNLLEVPDASGNKFVVG